MFLSLISWRELLQTASHSVAPLISQEDQGVQDLRLAYRPRTADVPPAEEVWVSLLCPRNLPAAVFYGKLILPVIFKASL